MKNILFAVLIFISFSLQSQVILGDCVSGGVGISSRYSDKTSAKSVLSTNKFLFPNTVTNCFLETHHLS